jgi:hypothetical protein
MTQKVIEIKKMTMDTNGPSTFDASRHNAKKREKRGR